MIATALLKKCVVPTALVALFAASAGAQDPYTNFTDPNGHTLPAYSPARPPAIPLAVRGPYTSAWSSTSFNGTLNSHGAMFWPGNGLGWEGMVSVDGITYEYLGTGSQSLPELPNFKTAVPKTVSYDSQFSNFTFAAGPVEITASFFSPVTPKDICRTSIPLSYLTTSIQSTDGNNHDVQFYSDVNGQWVAYESNVTIQWNLYEGSNIVNGSGNATTSSSDLYSWFYYLENAYLFGEEMDVPLWGNMTYTTSGMDAKNFSFQSGGSTNLRYSFISNHYLSDIVDTDYRGWGARDPAFAFAHDFGQVSNASVRYTVGTLQEQIMKYLYHGGVAKLGPWWSHCYGDMFSLIDFHWHDFDNVAQLGYDFEAQLKADVDSYYAANMAMVYSNSTPSAPPDYSNGSQGYTHGVDQYGDQYIFDPNNRYGFLDPNNFSGIAIPDVSEAETYYSIVALSARQVMGAYTYAIPPPAADCKNVNGTSDSTDPLMFQKEISSDGNVNTVDVLFPATPYFLWANPEMLRYTLEPLFENQEGTFYPNGYSMHDLGSHFPNATGHVEGDDEYMPVEESGNFILMAYSYYKFSGNSDWLKSHYALLKQFAEYLIEFSLTPGAQLSTDDFAGQLVNQTNLAIKGIVGLQAMSAVARIAGQSDDAANFSATATEYYQKWETYAIDPSENHTVLGYQWRSSWGLLYNIYPDKLLNLGIIDQRIYDMQSKWYPTVSQVFGIPLDNRHHYTKSDWEMWTAATCSPETRRLFVNGLGYWLNYTTTERAFTDLYEVIDDGYYPEVPDKVLFLARPVVGGHFSLLALERAGQHADAGTSLDGSSFDKNSTSALSSEVQLPTQANSDVQPSATH